jgi:geranylgeranyl reductase
MNPWQQLKLTFKTLGSVLRGQALAPSGYKAVPSAVRSEEETQAMLAVSTIRGGIRMPAQPINAQSVPGQADSQASEEKQPALAGR